MQGFHRLSVPRLPFTPLRDAVREFGQFSFSPVNALREGARQYHRFSIYLVGVFALALIALASGAVLWYASRTLIDAVFVTPYIQSGAQLSHPPTAPMATLDKDGRWYYPAPEDVVVADPIGVHFVKKGAPILDSPYTKIRPVTYVVAREDLMVRPFNAPLHLVRSGETYVEDAGTYVEPVAMEADAQMMTRTATEDTVIVGKDGLIVVKAGETYRVGAYTKTRPARYRTAVQDLSVSDVMGRTRVVHAGEQYLDDLTTYAEPYHSLEGSPSHM